MNFILFYLFYLRNLVVRNFMITPEAIVYYDKVIYFSGFYNIIYFFIKLVPFDLIKLISNFFNIKFIYKMDNIYHINSNTSSTHILPIILDINIANKHDDNKVPITFLYFNSNIPLSFVLKKNDLHNNFFTFKKTLFNFNYDRIMISYIISGKINHKVCYINDYFNSPIYKLF
jgi:hypothetical protein